MGRSEASAPRMASWAHSGGDRSSASGIAVTMTSRIARDRDQQVAATGPTEVVGAPVVGGGRPRIVAIVDAGPGLPGGLLLPKPEVQVIVGSCSGTDSAWGSPAAVFIACV